MKTMGRLLILLVLSIVMTTGILLYRGNGFLDRPMNLPAQGMNVMVEPGMSFRTLSRDLEQQGALDSGLFLYAFARATGRTGRLRVGEFYVPAGTTPRELLDILQYDKPVQYSLTLVEGWNIREMLAAIAGHPALKQTLKDLPPEEIMKRLGRGGEHPEGRFLPETYRFERGMTDKEFLERSYRDMDETLSRLWRQRAGDLPIATPYEALILASIVEKETAVETERKEIAGVFVRRLQKGMRLQTDPTVIYGMGENYQGNIRRVDLQADSPYNTYMRKGLPPTPICMPGKASLEAAMHPAKGDSLYFVARGDGTHQFSATLNDHNAAVRQFQLKR
ncbi:MAG: aminodeoxychorismate lyase [Gammaproteobacteria bacterium RIFOXYA12_FULL_61_12]|nr:MAG: aminodeoxychorismate lyase [Gammaproteobacteria bacterium RIFOXYA12_FULL_61_12]OGT91259.1 MAG: aminodeoxychorismate lyase [Gammaproteobacteria bacterium RIFOXYD12_FULL_61_37]